MDAQEVLLANRYTCKKKIKSTQNMCMFKLLQDLFVIIKTCTHLLKPKKYSKLVIQNDGKLFILKN